MKTSCLFICTCVTLVCLQFENTLLVHPSTCFYYVLVFHYWTFQIYKILNLKKKIHAKVRWLDRPPTRPPPLYNHKYIDSLFLIFMIETISRNNCRKIFFKKWIFTNFLFFPYHALNSFPLCPFDGPFFFENNLFYFLVVILIVAMSLELSRINPDRNIFSINVELTSTLFTLQRFGPSPTPNFKLFVLIYSERNICV